MGKLFFCLVEGKAFTSRARRSTSRLSSTISLIKLPLSLPLSSHTEREKQVLITGDEPTVHAQSRRSLNSHIDATNANTFNEGFNSLTITSFTNSNENNVQLPCVGRWGSEWPSWLNNVESTTRPGPGSVDHEGRNGSRLTDPECHEARRDVDAFVTGAQQGASSSGASSSGVSCCESDDDGSSSDSEDDDDDFSSDESLSLGVDKKWTTADGYNLTTFDQTECGTWAINQPLPLPLWAKTSKPTLTIDKVSQLKSNFPRAAHLNIHPPTALRVWEPRRARWDDPTAPHARNLLRHRKQLHRFPSILQRVVIQELAGILPKLLTARQSTSSHVRQSRHGNRFTNRTSAARHRRAFLSGVMWGVCRGHSLVHRALRREDHWVGCLELGEGALAGRNENQCCGPRRNDDTRSRISRCTCSHNHEGSMLSPHWLLHPVRRARMQARILLHLLPQER